ncbi:MAG: glycosyltransferase family 4 protein [Geobacteraceae bacterium]
MRIGLNAIGFNPGRTGGTETYFRQLLRHLQFESGEHSYIIACKNTEIGNFELQNPRFSVKEFKIGKPSLRWLIRGVLFEVAHIDIMKPMINSLPVDVLHHPFTVLEPLNLKIPSVLTFWDMQQEFYPGFFTRQQMRYRNYAYRTSAHQARRIIVSSEFTRTCLVELYDVSPEKIDIIYTGCGDGYRPIEDDAVLVAVKNRYSLPDEFIYYPAALWPHKNHHTLFDAVSLVRDKYGLNVKLVLSGMSTGRGSWLRAEILRCGLEEVVTVLGYLPYEDLPGLYNLATMMVFPSLFEGFGIPLVEAMACGCPIACSTATSIPEVVGRAAVLFDPMSVEEMAAAIFKVWDNRELRGKMRLDGLERAEMFDWRETACQTRAVYEKACN